MKKGAQLRLPGVDPRHQVRPNPQRTQPAFWVRRVQILTDLAGGAEHVLRDVKLRRGLNVVWAPPRVATEKNALFGDGVAGHTAGKSTFCRLVRHALGERGLAPETARRRLRAEFPHGWVLAEVAIGNVIWVAAKPLGIGLHPFCMRDADLTNVSKSSDRLDYAQFLAALEEATLAPSLAERFPGSQEAVRWEHLLPWLTRDQECRFADFLEWRHSSSGSDSPALNVDERQFLVRAMLDLVSRAERSELEKNARLLAEKKEATRLEPLLRHQAESDRRRLSKALGMDLSLVASPLFGSAARDEIARRKEDLERREAELSASDRRAELQAALTNANREEGRLKESVANAETRLATVRRSAAALAGKEQDGLLDELDPPGDFCNVPLRVAREKRCPLADGRPADLDAHRSERSAAEELAAELRLEASLVEEVSRICAAAEEAAASAAGALREYTRCATSYEAARFKLQEERSGLEQLGRLLRAAEAAQREAEAHAEGAIRLAREIDESYALQDKRRAEKNAAIGRVSARFDYIIRAVLGDKVAGRIEASGRSLALTVEEHGDRDSAAISTVKLLAFDLAAMVASIEGHGAFPRFLIHDGPREADMAPEVYERIFLLAHDLEKCFVEEPSFQYIVTTTTEPPARFASEPWCILKLAGAPTRERLLRRDL